MTFPDKEFGDAHVRSTTVRRLHDAEVHSLIGFRRPIFRTRDRYGPGRVSREILRRQHLQHDCASGDNSIGFRSFPFPINDARSHAA